MGKDNVTFHTIIFPSTLIGTKKNYTLLKHISTTDYLNYEVEREIIENGKSKKVIEVGKFSKTQGTGVFGNDADDTGINVEVWRYYLLVNRPEQSDTVFQWDDLAAKNNGELLCNLGNLTQRVFSFLKRFEYLVPGYNLSLLRDIDVNFLKVLFDRVIEYKQKLELVKIKDGLKLVMEISKECNHYMQEVAPWELIKTDKDL